MLLRAKFALHLWRSREIAQILARHGFDWALAGWDLGGIGGSLHMWRGRFRVQPLNGPQHLRLALEEMGATFIKLGQALSTRPDLLPADYIAELIKLQDGVTPVPYSAIAAAIKLELGREPDEIFCEFDKEPLATASIGQVHRACLNDGRRVIVKVQRPGVGARVEQDLAVLSDMAKLLARRDDWGDAYDFRGWVDEFASNLRDELDFTMEGRNADIMRESFEDDPMVRIPRVYWEHTTPRVMVQEEMVGIKIRDLAALDAAGIDRHALAENCARIALVQIFEHGFFHADPHPGNFFVEPNGTVALIDFGEVGRLDPPLRETLLRLTLTISRQDSDRLVDELLAIGATRRQLQRNVLKRDLDHIMHRYSNRPMAEISGANVFQQITNVAFHHHLQLPSELTLLFKVIVMDESLGAYLDPDFRLMEFAKPYLTNFWHESISVESIGKRIKETSLDMADISRDFPRHLKRILMQLQRGELTVSTHVEESKTVVKHLYKLANRISSSILIAGILIAISTVIHAYRPGYGRRKDDRLNRRATDASGTDSGGII